MQPNGVLLTKKSLIDETSFKFNVIAQDSNKVRYYTAVMMCGSLILQNINSSS